MHAGLINQFIEAQLILLAPVCPHFCDYMWRKVLQREGSVLKAAWPETPPVDINLAASAHDFNNSITTFRKLVLKALEPPKAKKGKAAAAPKYAPPNAAHIFVARNYPAWQSKALGYLNSKFDKVCHESSLCVAWGVNTTRPRSLYRPCKIYTRGPARNVGKSSSIHGEDI